MDYKVTKLDRRHTCYNIMKYIVEIDPKMWGKENRIERFQFYRTWCWENFGPGVERKWIMLHPTGEGLESINSWAWHTEYEDMRLYFKTDAELTFFTLKFHD